MRSVIFFLSLLCSLSLFSQEISIDFENSTLTDWVESNPGHWHIDTVSSINGKGSLHQNFDASESASDIISYKHTQLLLDSATTEWQFSVKYNYTPSASNNWAFWLSSNLGVQEMHPAGASQGYIVGVNYFGSDDLIKIWRQGGGSETAFITSDFNWQTNIPLGKTVNFKILRSLGKEWILQIDTLGGDFFTIGTGVDSTFSKSEYFGVYYEYSFTQDQKLWIDDIQVKGFFYEDKEAPKLSSFLVQEQNEILLNFNEVIDTTVEMLFILNRKYEPEHIILKSSTQVVLVYNIAFEENNLLEIYGLKDLKGNVSQIEQFNFQYLSPELHDVIISEIMADPDPKVKLPECEYVELFNRSEKTLNLKGWSFSSGLRKPIFLEDFNLEPKTYILLVDNDYIDEFPDSIQKMSFTSFPSLPNADETLALSDKYNRIIHKVNYTINLHSVAEKKDGGWSLEMVDFDYPCMITNNWKSSIFEEGGTPGYHNSVEGLLDYYPTSILREVSRITENNCTLVFSEPLDSISASIASNYELIDSDVLINSALPVSPDFREVILNFSKALSYESLYTLEISDGLYDCSGTDVFAKPLTFGLPQKADSADIIINEILFDGNDIIPEFIELYNKSDKVIDLKDLSVASIDEFADTVKSFITIIYNSYQLFPKAYVVLTQNKVLLMENVSNDLSGIVIETDSWLNLVNSGGKIGLTNSLGDILEQAIYSPEMHFPLLKSKSGVSLERISAFQSGTDTKNWHSASTGENYSTPGKENSQSRTLEDDLSQISISPKEFSPDNDGVDDFLTIQYNFLLSGFVASVKIYNQRGRLVNHLVNNELCGLSGNFNWDGLDENGGRLAMGYYIILIEAWHPDGSIVKEKKVCLLLPQIK